MTGVCKYDELAQIEFERRQHEIENRELIKTCEMSSTFVAFDSVKNLKEFCPLRKTRSLKKTCLKRDSMIKIIRLCLCSVQFTFTFNNLQSLSYAIYIRRINYLQKKKNKKIKIRIDPKK